jgi:hypothetical protein
MAREARTDSPDESSGREQPAVLVPLNLTRADRESLLYPMMFLLQPDLSLRHDALLELKLFAARDLCVDRALKLSFCLPQRGALGAQRCAFRTRYGKRLFSLYELGVRGLEFSNRAGQILLKIDSLVEELPLDLG